MNDLVGPIITELTSYPIYFKGERPKALPFSVDLPADSIEKEIWLDESGMGILIFKFKLSVISLQFKAEFSISYFAFSEKDFHFIVMRHYEQIAALMVKKLHQRFEENP